MKRFILPLCVGALLISAGLIRGDEPESIPLSQLGARYVLVGKLHVPIGKSVTAVGVVVEGAFKGYEGGPNLRVQRLDGQAIQEDIQICIMPYFSDWGKKPSAGSGIPLPKLETDKTYEMEGYESGGYVGVPAEAYEKAGAAIQTTGHYFREVFVVYRAELAAPVDYKPSDFDGRRALLQGTARSAGATACMRGDGWSVVVNASAPWPADIEGKAIETYGMYDATQESGKYTLIDGTWRLTRLEDQLGREVELRGRAFNMAYGWRLRYRGADVYVENMAGMPGWSDERHGQPVVIRGVLDKARLPDLDEAYPSQADPPLKEYFIVRKAEWEPLSALLAVERPMTDPY